MPEFRLYNSLTRSVEPFAPADGATVKLYTCGPTVYNPAHLGNFRTFLFEDLLRRVLRMRGWAVEQVMNLTDVDDKIIKRAVERSLTITALTKADHADRAHPNWREHMQSVGTIRTDIEVRVVDEDDNEVPLGEIGEVVVRGDVVMAGYWNQPEASAETLRGGWLHTGDMGSFDNDGYLTLRDRSKDLIISGGMNIYPREVEEALLLHPGVGQVAVVGRPDPEWGEAVVAFVVPADSSAPPSVAELDQACLDRIARFKRPKEYRFVDALPTNNYGKVVKRELRERLKSEL